MTILRPATILSAIASMWLCSAPAIAQDFCAPSEATDPQPLHINGSKPFVYKSVGGIDLRLHVFRSAALKLDQKVPAAVFFFGGGFIFGDIRRYQIQATHLALQGMVTVLVDYRVKCRHGATIMDEVSDAKSAMRWVRANADRLGVDPTRIAGVGSSAGAHLVAATALVPGFDDPKDPKVDPRPDAMILYNPGLDAEAADASGFITGLIGNKSTVKPRDLSPIHHLRAGLPPTIIFQGTADKLTPIGTARSFCDRAKALKAQCDLVEYAGAPHGFAEGWMGLDDASLGQKTEEWQWDTMRRSDEFLVRLGWLPGR
jgi:acetyl esterase